MARPSNALIVDDEAHVRAFLRLVLRELGIDTTWEAADGGEAIAMAKQHGPQLVLLDINLPVRSGLEVLAELQRQQPNLPVIIVTSQSSMKTVQDAVRMGATGYVLKHNAKDSVLKALRAALDELEADDEEEEEGGPPELAPH